MVARTNDHLFVTTAAAIIDRYVADLSEYLEVKDRIAAVATAYCESRTELDITVTVNAADDPEAGSVYLTTTGLSAEMGDDGGVGRGNRSNGLITPHRPMSLEATAGKNPVTHVGKLYNLKASQIAHRLHDEHNATYSTVQLLSRIGDPITEPAVIDITTTLPNEEPVRDVVADELNNLPALTQELVAGRIGTF